MKEGYGPEKGEEVFWRSVQAGKIKGAHHGEAHADDAQHMGFTSEQATQVKDLCDAVDSLSARIDAFQKQQHQRKPVDVKPKSKDNMQPSTPHPADPWR